MNKNKKRASTLSLRGVGLRQTTYPGHPVPPEGGSDTSQPH